MENFISYKLTEGNIVKALVRFALPVLFALILQQLYGAVDLFVVGRFGSVADVSGVSTGSLVTHTITTLVAGLSMGVTVVVGQSIGEGNQDKVNRGIGTGIFLFIIFAAIMTVLIAGGAEWIARVMDAPEEAFAQTVSYIRICGLGYGFVVAFNVIGSIFRGLGDSKTPLLTVSIACVANIVLDLVFVKGFGMGASGAALATILAQGISVVLSLLIISRRALPFAFSRKLVRFDKEIIAQELRLGVPIALQDFLTMLSFIIVTTVVNGMGLVASAGVGIGEKVSIFLMLIPSAYMQSISAFVAQNIGAKREDRAKKALLFGALSSLAIGVVMAYLAFAHGDLLANIFTTDIAVIVACQEYLRAYAMECMFVSVVFCFIGYYNGCGKTVFVMLQGLIGAFCVRVPIVLLVGNSQDPTLFKIGLATPMATAAQLVLCLIMFAILFRKKKS